MIRGYRAVIDPESLGRAFEVLPEVTLESQDARTVECFEDTMIRLDEVRELRRLFGTPDYFIRVAVAELNAYETFLSRHVRTVPRVQRDISRFTMKTIE